MGRKGEMQPSQIVDAVRDALPTAQVVDLTPSLMGAGCVMSLNLKDGPVYVLPNCKSVRKKLARGGMSAKAGSLRHDFEECDGDARRPFIIIYKGVTFGNQIPLHASLAEACERLARLIGDTCAICQEPLVKKPGLSIGCKHFFHKKCLWKWTKTCCENGDYEIPCPLCRSPINPGGMF